MLFGLAPGRELGVTVTDNEAQVSTFVTAYVYRVGGLSGSLTRSGTRHTYRLRHLQGRWLIVSFAVVVLWMEGGEVFQNPSDLKAVSAENSGR